MVAPPKSDLIRRLLLVLVTGLLVARPLVGGEHPGLMSDFSDPGSMTLVFLTLLGCAAWAGWRLWTGQAAVYGGAVEGGLMLLAGLLIVGVGNASARRPGWLVGCDWVGMVLLAVLIRQLAVRAEERQGLLAVLLAIGGALTAEGTYQAVYDLPRQAREERKHRLEHSEENSYLQTELRMRALRASPLEMEQLRDRLEKQRVHGPYFLPTSLAAVLVLLLPVVAGALVAGIRGDAAGWQIGLTAVLLLGMGSVLLLTRAWPAVIVLGLAGLTLGAVLGLGRIAGLITALLATAGGMVGLYQSGMLESAQEVWPATWKMLQEHLAWGVGPGQFGMYYPRYMAATAGVKAVEAGNAFLEMWSNVGLVGVIVLAGVVVLFVRAVWRWSTGRTQATSAGEETTEEAQGRVSNWEYYLGGMVGLLLAFVLRAGTVPTDDILTEAILAGLRSVVWFGAFALFEDLAWSEGEYVTALTTGIGAMFGYLLVAPGIDYPSVMTLLLAGMMLVLATVSVEPARWLSQQSSLHFVTIPALVGIAFAYFALIFYPAANSASALRRSRLAQDFFLGEMTKEMKERNLGDPVGFVRARILGPLTEAVKEDPENVRLLVPLAEWYGQLWALAPTEQTKPGPEERALAYAVRAQQVHPEGPEGYLAEFHVRRRLAAVMELGAKQLEQEEKKDEPRASIPLEQRKQLAGRLRQQAKQQLELAAEVLQRYLPKDPTSAELRHDLAGTLFEAGRVREAQEEAELSLRFDEKAGVGRKLTDRQREQVEKWRNAESGR